MKLEELEDLSRRSKDDNLSKMIVGSEVRALIQEIHRLRLVCATAAADLVRECREKNVDTMWSAPGMTLWEYLNANGDQLEEPVASEPIP